VEALSVKNVYVKGMAVVGAVALAGALASCAQSQRTPSGTTSGAGAGGGNFVFAASSDPVMLDPAMASDGETFRVARQQFEGLVSTKPGTTDTEPLLATKWDVSSDGLSYTFTLRDGVKFSDGTDFNAAAVCYNFDRWYNWTGVNQSENISYYYTSLFKGFKTGKTGGIYDSCEAKSASEAVIKLKKPFAAFVQAMTLPAFSMQSPDALKKYNADKTGGTDTDPRFSEYATAHPTGTGPFVFDKWDRGQQVTLKRNDNYWGEKAKIATVIIRTISDSKARTQELQAGNIDGYDLVGPADVEPLKQAGFQILNRPAFNILYLGMNQKNKALQDIKVRQAISYAIDKAAVVKSSLPAGSVPAKEFMPNLVEGYDDSVAEYAYDLNKAKDLLKQAGQENLTLKFAYPTGVSRPYMPAPEDTFAVIKSQLEKAGIKITPVAAKWSPDYLDMVQGDKGVDKHDIHLLGWTGDYNDADNFVGVFFGRKSSEWGFDNAKLFDDLAKARELPTRDEQIPAYKKLNAEIADYVPGVPLAHPAPSLAFGKGVQGYAPSPVQDEVWNKVTVTK
jgi:peptide/nickel transport system substrate-binding protein